MNGDIPFCVPCSRYHLPGRHLEVNLDDCQWCLTEGTGNGVGCCTHCYVPDYEHPDDIGFGYPDE